MFIVINRVLEAIRSTSLIVKLIGAFVVVALLVAAGLFAARHTVEASFWDDGKGKRHAQSHEYDRSGKFGRDAYAKGLVDKKGTPGLVISDTRMMHKGGTQSLRYAVGNAQNVDTAAGTFDLLLLDGSGTLPFTIDDNTKVFINGREGMSGLDADSLVTVIETRDLDGWATRLGRGFGIFSDDGTVKSEVRYLSDGGVKSVSQVVGTPQNIDTSAGTFELLLRDGSAVMSFELGSDAEALALGLNTENSIAVVQTTGADGSTDLQIMTGGEQSRGRVGMFGWFGDRDGDGRGRGRGHD